MAIFTPLWKVKQFYVGASFLSCFLSDYRYLLYSLVKESCYLVLRVLERLCLQRLLQLKLVQTLLTYQCQVLLQRYFCILSWLLELGSTFCDNY